MESSNLHRVSGKSRLEAAGGLLAQGVRLKPAGATGPGQLPIPPCGIDVAGVVERVVEAEILHPAESPPNCSSRPFHRECRSWTGPGLEALGEGEVSVAEEVALARRDPRQGGNLRRRARVGQIRRPPIVRPISEDVITGQLFQALGCVNPRRRLPDPLNAALGSSRFRKQIHRRFKIQLRRNPPRHPRELLPRDEGSTRADAGITWENPPPTVFIKAAGIPRKTASVRRLACFGTVG